MSKVVSEEPTGKRQTWQARKSEETRTEILQAALQSYIDVGYGRTTLQQIADRTGLSRGAIIYHFPSMPELTRAAVSYIADRWLTSYGVAIETIQPGDDFVDLAIERFWEHLCDPLFAAFHELTIAARTDPELQEIVLPAEAQFESEFNRIGREHSAAASDKDDRFEIVTGIAKYLLTGMAFAGMWRESPERKRRLLEHTKDHIRLVLAEGPHEGEHAVHQGGLAMVDVGDDGQIAELRGGHGMGQMAFGMDGPGFRGRESTGRRGPGTRGCAVSWD